MCLLGGGVFRFLNHSLGSPLIILYINWGNLEISLYFERNILFYLFIYLYILFMTKLHVV